VSRGSWQEDVDDVVGMQEYSLCTILDCGSAC
jgi:hypothetical protein